MLHVEASKIWFNVLKLPNIFLSLASKIGKSIFIHIKEWLRSELTTYIVFADCLVFR